MQLALPRGRWNPLFYSLPRDPSYLHFIPISVRQLRLSEDRTRDETKEFASTIQPRERDVLQTYSNYNFLFQQK